MNLLLWRHAEAHDGVPDLGRTLTHTGRTQANKVGRWIKERIPSEASILVSPAVRTRQTADALGREYVVTPWLAPGSNPNDILSALSLSQTAGRDETVVLVGHQPWIGELAALLVSGSPANWSVRKAAVWWLVYRRRAESADWSVKAVTDDRLL